MREPAAAAARCPFDALTIGRRYPWLSIVTSHRLSHNRETIEIDANFTALPSNRELTGRLALAAGAVVYIHIDFVRD